MTNQTDDLVEDLFRRGARYVLPVHVSDNAFGGAAVYNGFFAVGNRLLLGRPFSITFDARLHYRLPDWAVFATNFSPGVGIIGEAGGSEPGDRGHRNLVGLTDAGRALVQRLMQRGMLVDVDHMSELTLNDTLDLAQEWHPEGYPLVSGHAGIRAMGRRRDETSDDEKLTSETLKTDDALVRIRKLGGMVAPNTPLLDVPLTAPATNVIQQECAGSSTAWAATYSYLVSVIGAGNVAIGSDFNGLLAHPGPRFGTFACHGLKGDERRGHLRPAQAAAQTNGVRYTTPVRYFGESRFAADGFLTDEERDVWRALAWVDSGSVPSRLADPGPFDRWRNLAIGFTVTSAADPRLDCPEYPVVGGCPDERRAAFLSRAGLPPIGDEVTRLVNVIRPILDRWNSMAGSNPPLEKGFYGQRDFDINLDGFAHYGMLPDFLQDARNVGADLNPLFRSAEDFVRTWEKALRMRRP